MIDPMRGAFSAAMIESRGAGDELANDAAAPPAPRRLLSGWAGRAFRLPDGRRQIVRIYIPGDLWQAPAGPRNPCASIALSRVRLQRLQDDDAAWPALLRRADAEERLGLLHQVLRLGRLSAYERMSHLLMELYERHGRAGLNHGAAMPVPVTQDVWADALGLSLVHTNRVLQQLRRDRLIVLRRSCVAIPSPDKLAATCGYELTWTGETGARRPQVASPRPAMEPVRREAAQPLSA